MLLLLSSGGQVAPFTGQVQASLASWADPAGDWQAYNAALGGMFEQVYALVAPTGVPDEPAGYHAGWGTLLDPSTCPDWALPYAGQFVGVQVPAGMSAATARARILAEANFQTGTAAAVVAAARLWLSGSQTVTLLERTAADGQTTDPYHFVLIVNTSQVVDATQLARAVNAVKPAGVQWTLTQVAYWTISQLEAAGYSNISAVESAFPSINNLETDVP